MNIHVSKLLKKMEKELVKAKSTGTDKELRERIAVIQSLCEVILDEQSASFHIVSPEPNKIDPEELQKMMGNTGSTVKQSSNVLSSSPLKENGANGDSLFDF